MEKLHALITMHVYVVYEYYIYYLTIRLQARDFCEVMVDEGEPQINYHLAEIESE
jgi:hypothetical protein